MQRRSFSASTLACFGKDVGNSGGRNSRGKVSANCKSLSIFFYFFHSCMPCQSCSFHMLDVTHLKSSIAWSQKTLWFPDLTLLPKEQLRCGLLLGVRKKQKHLWEFIYIHKTWTRFSNSSVFLVKQVVLVLKKLTLFVCRTGGLSLIILWTTFEFSWELLWIS